MQEVRLIYAKDEEELVYKMNTLLRENSFLELQSFQVTHDKDNRLCAFMVFENSQIPKSQKKYGDIPNCYRKVAEEEEQTELEVKP